MGATSATKSAGDASGSDVVARDLTDGDAVAMEKRLNAAASDISAMLARRTLVSRSPFRLCFRAAEAPAAAEPRSPLWHIRRRDRRLAVHGAARSWAAAMHW